MSNSLFLARLIGPVMRVVGLAVFANQRGFREMAEEFMASRALMFLSGLITMPAGLAIVLTHNVWAADWRVLITVIGWLATITGAFRIIAPQDAIKFGRRVYDQPNGVLFGAAVWIAIGAILCFFGYVR